MARKQIGLRRWVYQVELDSSISLRTNVGLGTIDMNSLRLIYLRVLSVIAEEIASSKRSK